MDTIESPSNSLLIFLLIIICLSSVNNYFCYHAPSAIATEFEDQYHLNTQQFGSLFTIYSAPNVIFVFFSGLIIDKYGARSSAIVFNFIILLGMIICALTPYPSKEISNSFCYLSLLLGRFLLGIGGESICACTSTMLGQWYSKSGFLNTCMAVNQGMVQLLGSSAVFFLLPRINSLNLSNWITVLVASLSLISVLLYSYFEIKYHDYLVDLNKIDNEIFISEESNVELSLQENGKVYYQSINKSENEIDVTNEKSFWIKDLFYSLPLQFWLLWLHIGLMSPILYTFTAFGPLYLQENFESTATLREAGDCISLLYLSIFFAPITGLVIDYVSPYRTMIQTIASFNIPIIFIILTYKLLSPKVCMLWMGFIFSITESNSFAILSITVSSDRLGTAFGLVGCAVSIALLFEPLIVGTLKELTGKFTITIWMFTLISLLGSLISVVIFYKDKRRFIES